MSNVIVSPPLTSRLLERSLCRRYGFTYWERSDERLTNALFRTVTNVRKVRSFAVSRNTSAWCKFGPGGAGMEEGKQ
jgi:hypothetical protein